MKNSTEKEKIIKTLRECLINKDTQVSTTETHEEIFAPYKDDPVMVFAEKFSIENGHFVYCQSEKELFEKLKTLAGYRSWDSYNAYSANLQSYLESNGIKASMADHNSSVGISICQGIVANTGSIIITSTQGAGETLIHFPQIMIVIAMTSQIYTSYKQILNLLPEIPPKWIMSIKSGKLIKEEIQELYMFVVDE